MKRPIPQITEIILEELINNEQQSMIHAKDYQWRMETDREVYLEERRIALRTRIEGLTYELRQLRGGGEEPRSPSSPLLRHRRWNT
jgi:Fic family protein